MFQCDCFATYSQPLIQFMFFGPWSRNIRPVISLYMIYTQGESLNPNPCPDMRPTQTLREGMIAFP